MTNSTKNGWGFSRGNGWGLNPHIEVPQPTENRQAAQYREKRISPVIHTGEIQQSIQGNTL